MSINDTSIDLKDVFNIKWNEDTNMNYEECRSGMIGDNGCITGINDEENDDLNSTIPASLDTSGGNRRLLKDSH